MTRDLLRDGGGRVVGNYLPGARDGRSLADLVVAAPGVTVAEVAVALARGHPGWFVATEDPELVKALMGAGAATRRRASMFELDLGAVPVREPAAPPSGVVVVPLIEVPQALGPVVHAAYPPGHPDHQAGESEQRAVEDLRDHVLGRGGWTALPGCFVALRGGDPVGAVIVNALEVATHPEPIGWVTELFRLPGSALRGLGAVLLDTAVLAVREAGARTVGLAVSAGSPARALYEGRGFVAVSDTTTVELPG